MPIFDQGYQHWKGPLSGHAWRWWAIARHGVRAQLKGRILRVLLLVAWLPALALAAALAVWGMLEQKAETVLSFLGPLLPPDMINEPEAYRSAVWTIAYSIFFKVELFFVLFVVMLVGPNLISGDLRFNALPLYFSRPLRRIDYFLGKLGVIAFFLGAVAIVPALVAYLLGLCFSLDLGVVKDTHRALWGSLAYGLVIVVAAGTLMLALSSLSRRSIYVGLTWVGLWIISASVSGILQGVQAESLRRHLLEKEIAPWLEAHPPPEGITMRGPYPVFEDRVVRGKRQPRRGGFQMTPEQQRWFDAWSKVHAESFRKAEEGRLEAGRNDWRPLCSFSTNLDRMGDVLLDTDSAWVAIGQALQKPRQMFAPFLGGRRGPPGGPGTEPGNERTLANQLVWQYPWGWSAAVLAGLVGVSVCVLSLRVKSLDRLR
jgi:ABC-2 type transport system permease protein